MLEGKFGRLIVNIVLTFAVIMISVLVISELSSSNDIQNLIICGSLAFAGTSLYHIAFDLLGECESWFFGFIRIVFLILGTLVILILGIFSLITTITDISLAEIQSVSPWLYGWGLCWPLGTFSSFILYYFEVDCDWMEEARSFIPLICVILSYIVCVIFTAIGNSVGAFFYWMPFILVGGEIIFIIWWLKREGLPF